MRSRLLLNLVLLALVGALALVAVYRPGVEPEPPAARLTALAADGVARIRLQRPDQPDVVMERGTAGWRMTEPIAGRVSGFRARGLAALAEAEVVAQFEAPADALAQYGLDAPQATVVLDDAAIALGDINPVNRNRYVLHDGRVYLVADTQLAQATAAPADLLDTRLFGDGVDPVAIRLPQLALTRSEGRWSADPPRDELDPDRIVSFVDRWRFARATRVGVYDGPPPAQSVVVEFRRTAESARESLELGIVRRSPDTVLLRRDEGLAYHFDTATGERLLDPAAD